MKTKFNDVPYCGVRESKIWDACPTFIHGRFPMLVKYIKRRYNIHLRKDVYGKEKPWTKDLILRNFRFTNVRREHDKETIWLIKHIAENDELCYEDKLLNCILFRLFNKHETSELIEAPIAFLESDDWNPEAYRSVFENKKLEDSNYVFFTGAFYTTGMKMNLKRYMPEYVEDTMEMRIMYFIKYLIDNDFIDDLRGSEIQEDVFLLLSSMSGIGDFLAYQIFVDFTYIEEFPFSENEFVVAGTGCIKGLNELFSDRNGMTYEECLFWLRDNWKALNEKFIPDPKDRFIPERDMKDLPEYDRVMNVMSLENCFCEFSKYVRASLGTGRPRKKYKG